MIDVKQSVNADCLTEILSTKGYFHEGVKDVCASDI